MGFSYIEEVPVDEELLASSSVAEDDYPVWGDSPSTDYDTGTRIIYPFTHQVFESLEDNNSFDPLDDPDGEHWLLVGYTNRWRMFDQSPQSVTTAADTMSQVFLPGQYINALALLEVDAATVTVQQFRELTQEVFAETFDMISDEGILDYEPYFFWPVERKSELYINTLAPHDDASLVVTFDSAAGEDVSCGVLKFGLEVTLGNTAWGPRIGMEDYSVKEVDVFGQSAIQERAYNLTGEFTLLLTPGQVDAARRRLTALRATPVVWVGDPDYGSTLIYGFVNDFAVEIAGPTLSYCNLSLKGLA